MGEQQPTLGSAQSLTTTSTSSSNATSPEDAISEAVIEGAVPIKGLDPHDHKALVGIDRWQDIQLKKSYARWLLILVAAQLVVADAVFIAYAWAGSHWHLDASVVQFWLAATLVELIGVALVITRYLFPRRDLSPDSNS